MARKKKSDTAASADALEHDDEIVLVAADETDVELDDFGMFANGSEVLEDIQAEVNPLGVCVPTDSIPVTRSRSKTSVSLEDMTVTVDDTLFELGRLSPQMCNRLALEGLKSVLLRDGMEVFSKLEDGTYKTREPVAPKPNVRTAVVAALVERGVEEAEAVKHADSLNREMLGRMRRDPDVARHLSALRGETSMLYALVNPTATDEE